MECLLRLKLLIEKQGIIFSALDREIIEPAGTV
jgi:hypothetical protein